ncbi:hypothetical protein OG792_13550 [Micromonospora sp. NBC_01699]|uniref:hypothetical protein n=1 Tax=Micromonospora sp. NBC_01699 TaxID=2975984 RepID=UPI002E33EB7B|nr:hypothetical protein [Micromonospora sp. NBC_01699]
MVNRVDSMGDGPPDVRAAVIRGRTRSVVAACMSSRDKLSALLAGAGLKLLDVPGSGDELPVTAASLVTSCGPEHGRRDEVVELGDPHLVEKANAGWFRLASEYGLFSQSREFLLGVDFAGQDAAPILRWVRVQLQDDWDIMGAGAASGILGAGSGWPGFVMMSLDGEVIVGGTTWQRSIGSLAVRHPSRIQLVRDYVGRLIVNPRTASDVRAEGERWLSSTA